MHTSVRLQDVPGSLAGLLSLIAQCGGNIIHIGHWKEDPDLPPGMVIVDIDIETRGPGHVQEIEQKIQEAGFLTT
jgi:threonine dehydratase